MNTYDVKLLCVPAANAIWKSWVNALLDFLSTCLPCCTLTWRLSTQDPFLAPALALGSQLTVLGDGNP